MKTLLPLPLIFVVAACSSRPVSPGSGVSRPEFPYDNTIPFTARLSDWAVGPQSESRLPGREIVELYLCGEYRRGSVVDSTGGCVLHVYPDHTAIIGEWFDVMPIESIVADGEWSVSAAGGVVFDWRYWNSEAFLNRQYFQERYGECKEMTLLFGFADGRLKDVVLISKEMIGMPDHTPFSRCQEYSDWQATAKELRSEKAKSVVP